MSASRPQKPEPLALLGGPKAKRTPYGTARRFGKEELKELKEALAQNTLFYAKGRKVREFCRRLAAKYGLKHCVATTSGTAAIHVALAAVGVTVGDEVITSVLTDAGSFMPILYQNAIPVFADVDPRTYNMTAETVARKVTRRTKAILVVHLAGSPADMAPIMKLARRHKLYVIEDCAQSWQARYRGRLVGTIGHIGCFSLNDFKHISVGDGGALLTDDDRLASRAALLADKCYPRGPEGRRSGRLCQFAALNYRMSELAGAVALAQLRKVDRICSRRRKHGALLTRLIEDIPGILPPVVLPRCESSNWYYTLRVDDKLLGVSRDEFMAALRAEGLPASFYLARVDQYEMFQKRSIYPPRRDKFVCPYDCPAYGGKVSYRAADCPNVDLVLKTGIILQMSEFYGAGDIRETAAAIRKVAGYYLAESARHKGRARRVFPLAIGPDAR
jgi:dTDP-4-amino-4,6-dideoxygalactose transaminase